MAVKPLQMPNLNQLPDPTKDLFGGMGMTSPTALMTMDNKQVDELLNPKPLQEALIKPSAEAAKALQQAQATQDAINRQAQQMYADQEKARQQALAEQMKMSQQQVKENEQRTKELLKAQEEAKKKKAEEQGGKLGAGADGSFVLRAKAEELIKDSKWQGIVSNLQRDDEMEMWLKEAETALRQAGVTDEATIKAELDVARNVISADTRSYTARMKEDNIDPLDLVSSLGKAARNIYRGAGILFGASEEWAKDEQAAIDSINATYSDTMLLDQANYQYQRSKTKAKNGDEGLIGGFISGAKDAWESGNVLSGIVDTAGYVPYAVLGTAATAKGLAVAGSATGLTSLTTAATAKTTAATSLGGRFVGTLLSAETAGAGVTSGVLAATDAAGGAFDSVVSMDFKDEKTLATVKANYEQVYGKGNWDNLVAQYGGDMDKVKQELATQSARMAGGRAFITTAPLGVFGLEATIAKMGTQGVASMAGRRMLTVGANTVSETLEEGFTQYSQNYGAKPVTGVDLTDDVGATAAMGAIAGGGMAAGTQAIGALADGYKHTQRPTFDGDSLNINNWVSEGNVNYDEYKRVVGQQFDNIARDARKVKLTDDDAQQLQQRAYNEFVDNADVWTRLTPEQQADIKGFVNLAYKVNTNGYARYKETAEAKAWASQDAGQIAGVILDDMSNADIMNAYRVKNGVELDQVPANAREYYKTLADVMDIMATQPTDVNTREREAQYIKVRADKVLTNDKLTDLQKKGITMFMTNFMDAGSRRMTDEQQKAQDNLNRVADEVRANQQGTNYGTHQQNQTNPNQPSGQGTATQTDGTVASQSSANGAGTSEQVQSVAEELAANLATGAGSGSTQGTGDGATRQEPNASNSTDPATPTGTSTDGNHQVAGQTPNTGNSGVAPTSANVGGQTASQGATGQASQAGQPTGQARPSPTQTADGGGSVGASPSERNTNDRSTKTLAQIRAELKETGATLSRDTVGIILAGLKTADKRGLGNMKIHKHVETVIGRKPDDVDVGVYIVSLSRNDMNQMLIDLYGYKGLKNRAVGDLRKTRENILSKHADSVYKAYQDEILAPRREAKAQAREQARQEREAQRENDRQAKAEFEAERKVQQEQAKEQERLEKEQQAREEEIERADLAVDKAQEVLANKQAVADEKAQALANLQAEQQAISERLAELKAWLSKIKKDEIKITAALNVANTAVSNSHLEWKKETKRTEKADKKRQWELDKAEAQRLKDELTKITAEKVVAEREEKELTKKANALTPKIKQATTEKNKARREATKARTKADQAQATLDALLGIERERQADTQADVSETDFANIEQDQEQQAVNPNLPATTSQPQRNKRMRLETTSTGRPTILMGMESTSLPTIELGYTIYLDYVPETHKEEVRQDLMDSIPSDTDIVAIIRELADTIGVTYDVMLDTLNANADSLNQSEYDGLASLLDTILADLYGATDEQTNTSTGYESSETTGETQRTEQTTARQNEIAVRTPTLPAVLGFNSLEVANRELTPLLDTSIQTVDELQSVVNELATALGVPVESVIDYLLSSPLLLSEPQGKILDMVYDEVNDIWVWAEEFTPPQPLGLDYANQQEKEQSSAGVQGTRQISSNINRATPALTAPAETAQTTGKTNSVVPTTYITDENGKPITFYHVRAAELENDLNPYLGNEFGIHFGDKEAVEVRKGGITNPVIIAANLRMDNPVRLIDPDTHTFGSWNAHTLAFGLTQAGLSTETHEIRDEFLDFLDERGEYNTSYYGNPLWNEFAINYLRHLGYDGVVYKNVTEGNADSYIAFDTNQIDILPNNDQVVDEVQDTVTTEDGTVFNLQEILSGVTNKRVRKGVVPPTLNDLAPENNSADRPTIELTINGKTHTGKLYRYRKGNKRYIAFVHDGNAYGMKAVQDGVENQDWINFGAGVGTKRVDSINTQTQIKIRVLDGTPIQQDLFATEQQPTAPPQETQSDTAEQMVADTSYQMGHTAPVDLETDSPLYELDRNTYPSDVYSSKAAHLYGSGFDQADQKALQVINRVRGNPNADVVIYRAVHSSIPTDTINEGDWVTLTREYADEHGNHALRGEYKVLTKTVKAADLYTDGNSLQEWGYTTAHSDNQQETQDETQQTGRVADSQQSETTSTKDEAGQNRVGDVRTSNDGYGEVHGQSGQSDGERSQETGHEATDDTNELGQGLLNEPTPYYADRLSTKERNEIKEVADYLEATVEEVYQAIADGNLNFFTGRGETKGADIKAVARELVNQDIVDSVSKAESLINRLTTAPTVKETTPSGNSVVDDYFTQNPKDKQVLTEYLTNQRRELERAMQYELDRSADFIDSSQVKKAEAAHERAAQYSRQLKMLPKDATEMVNAYLTDGVALKDAVKQAVKSTKPVANGFTFDSLPQAVQDVLTKIWNKLKSTVATVSMVLALAVGSNMVVPTDAMAATPIETATVQHIVQTNDNQGKQFIVADKQAGTLTVYTPTGQEITSTSALFGKAIGDSITDKNTTPSGRYDMTRVTNIKGNDRGQYGTSAQALMVNGKLQENNAGNIAIHKVLPIENRQGRLDSATATDNRISHGCINVPIQWYDTHLDSNMDTVVYVLPETEAGRTGVFADVRVPQTETQPTAPTTQSKVAVDNAQTATPVEPAMDNANARSVEVTPEQIKSATPADQITQAPTKALAPVTIAGTTPSGQVAHVAPVVTGGITADQINVPFDVHTPAELQANGVYDTEPVSNSLRADGGKGVNIYELAAWLAGIGAGINVIGNRRRKKLESKKSQSSDSSTVNANEQTVTSEQNPTGADRQEQAQATVDENHNAQTNKSADHVVKNAQAPQQKTAIADAVSRAMWLEYIQNSHLTQEKDADGNMIDGQTYSDFLDAMLGFEWAIGDVMSDKSIEQANDGTFSNPLKWRNDIQNAKRAGISAKLMNLAAGVTQVFDNLMTEHGIARIGHEMDSSIPSKHLAQIKAKANGAYAQIHKLYVKPISLKIDILAGNLRKKFAEVETDVGRVATVKHVLNEAAEAMWRGREMEIAEHRLNLQAMRNELTNTANGSAMNVLLAAKANRLQKHIDTLQTKLNTARDMYEGRLAWDGKTGMPGGYTKAQAEQVLKDLQSKYGSDYAQIEQHATELVQTIKGIRNFAASAGVFSNADLQTFADLGFTEYVPLYREQADPLAVDDSNNYTHQSFMDELLADIPVQQARAMGLTKDLSRYHREGATSPAADAFTNMKVFSMNMAGRIGQQGWINSVQQLYEGTVGKPITDTRITDEQLLADLNATHDSGKLPGLIRVRPGMEQFAGIDTGKLKPIVGKGYDSHGDLVTFHYYFTEPAVQAEIYSNSDLTETLVMKGLRNVGTLTRLAARMMTTFKPVWNIYNWVRDSFERISIMLMRPVKDSNGNLVNKWDLSKAYFAELAKLASSPQAQSEIYHYLVLGETKTQLQKILNEAVGEGAINLMTSQTEKHSIMADLNKSTVDKLYSQIEAMLGHGMNKAGLGKVKRGADQLVDMYVMRLTEVPQITTALASYMAYQKLGVNKAETTNRVRDQYDPTRANNKVLNTLSQTHPFIRSTFSGHYNLARTLTEYWKPGTWQAPLAYMVVGTLGTMAVLTMMAGLFGDDEDGVPKIARLPIGTLMGGIPVPTENGVWSLPVGFGMNKLIWGIGANLWRQNMGMQTGGETAKQMMGLIVDNTSPIQMASGNVMSENLVTGLALTAAPLLTKPLMEIATNTKSFGGAKIIGRETPKDQYDSDQDNFNVPETYKTWAKFLRETTGIDMRPETVRHLFESYMYGPAGAIPKSVIQDSSEKSLGNTQRKGEIFGPFLTAIGADMAIQPNALDYAQHTYVMNELRMELHKRYGVGETHGEEVYEQYADRGKRGGIIKRAATVTERAMRDKGVPEHIIEYVVNGMRYNAARKELDGKYKDLATEYYKLRQEGKDDPVMRMAVQSAYEDLENLTYQYVKDNNRAYFKIMQEQ